MCISRFHKVIICILIVSFACILAGSIDTIRSQIIGATENPKLSLLTGFLFCLICLLITWKTFIWIDHLNEKGCLAFSLIVLLLMTGLFVVVSLSARVSQYADSIDVMDTAFYLRNHMEVSEELPYIRYVSSFGYNFPVILFESFLIKTLSSLGFQDVEIVLDRLNLVVLMTAVILTWFIVKETRGIKAAAKTALICLMNPYLYLTVNWTYTMTYSLPIMMGILYTLLQLKKAKTISKGIILAVVEGLLIGGGILIRITTIFPLIAAVMIWFPSLFRETVRIREKRIVQLICILLVAIIAVLLVNIQADRRLGKIKSQNMPLLFWTMMGSHGDGRWNDEDLEAMMTIQNPEDRAKFALEQTLNNYAELGIDGTINFWREKLDTSWSNGGFFIGRLL